MLQLVSSMHTNIWSSGSCKIWSLQTWWWVKIYYNKTCYSCWWAIQGGYQASGSVPSIFRGGHLARYSFPTLLSSTQFVHASLCLHEMGDILMWTLLIISQSTQWKSLSELYIRAVGHQSDMAISGFSHAHNTKLCFLWLHFQSKNVWESDTDCRAIVAWFQLVFSTIQTSSLRITLVILQEKKRIFVCRWRLLCWIWRQVAG